MPSSGKFIQESLVFYSIDQHTKYAFACLPSPSHIGQVLARWTPMKSQSLMTVYQRQDI